MSQLDKRPSYEEIQRVVKAFYQKATQDPQLAPFFASIEDFSAHEQRISDFWWLSMGGTLENPPTPKIDMIGKHFPLDIQPADLQQWLALFSETLEQELDSPKGLFWMDKVMTIAARLKQIVIDRGGPGIGISEPK